MKELHEIGMEELENAVGGEGGDCIIYVVRLGDDLTQISRRFHVSGARIIAWNRLRSADDIYPGQNLKIYT